MRMLNCFNFWHVIRAKSVAVGMAVLSGIYSSGNANAQTVDIVGLGASSCQRFLSDIAINPHIEGQYLAWAQGYLSGLLIRAPKGVDENLKLLPVDFPIQRQAVLLKKFCRTNSDKDYVDGVQLLYKTLRKTTG